MVHKRLRKASQADDQLILLSLMEKRQATLRIASSQWRCNSQHSTTCRAGSSQVAFLTRRSFSGAGSEGGSVTKAELAVESKGDMIVVNVNMVTAKNEPVQGPTPAVILLQGKTKTNIDKTMDGKKLPAGNYIMSVVSEGKTASILFTIN